MSFLECLILVFMLIWGIYHSVSAFGSSIGTLIRSSIGAAMFAENVGMELRKVAWWDV
jgi:hypothetical protein